MDKANLPWREAFVGSSCLALVAAVRAGLGIAPLGPMIGAELLAPSNMPVLPPLPSSQIVMLARTPTPEPAAAARALAASVRDTLRHSAS